MPSYLPIIIYKKKHSEIDYYQTNSGHDGRQTFYFDMHVIEPDSYEVSIDSKYHSFDDIFIQSPSGQIIKKKQLGKNYEGDPFNSLKFRALVSGKYVIKYRLCYIHRATDVAHQDLFYDIIIKSTDKEYCTVSNDTGPCVYNKLGTKRDGARHKGENLKEKNQEYDSGSSNQTRT